MHHQFRDMIALAQGSPEDGNVEVWDLRQDAVLLFTDDPRAAARLVRECVQAGSLLEDFEIVNFGSSDSYQHVLDLTEMWQRHSENLARMLRPIPASVSPELQTRSVRVARMLHFHSRTIARILRAHSGDVAHDHRSCSENLAQVLQSHSENVAKALQPILVDVHSPLRPQSAKIAQQLQSYSRDVAEALR